MPYCLRCPSRFFIYAVVFATAGGFAHRALAQGEDAYRRGTELLKQRKYTDAIAAFGEAIQDRPDYAAAYLYRGYAYRLNAQPELAIGDLSQALKLEPGSARAREQRGLANLEVFDLAAAIADLSEVLRTKPDDAAILEARGTAYARDQQPKLALADFRRAFSLDSRSMPAVIGAAEAMIATGDAKRAITTCDQLTKKDPNLAMALVVRARAHAAEGAMKAALDDLERAIAIDSRLGNAYVARAEFMLEQQNFVATLRDVSQALECTAYDDQRFGNATTLRLVAHLLRGMASSELDDTRQALEDYDRAVELSHGLPLPLLHRAVLLIQMGRQDDALADLDRALKKKPDFEAAIKIKEQIESGEGI